MSRGTVVSPVPNATLAARLEAGLERQANGCREWTGYVDKESGYGKIANRPGPPVSVHVAAWIVHRGPVPTGLVVRHRCDNPPCGDIEHLLLGTQADNVADMIERDRINPHLADSCPVGHLHDESDSEGYPGCSACRLKRARYASRMKRQAAGKVPRWPTCEGCEYAVPRCKCAELKLGVFLPVLEIS